MTRRYKVKYKLLFALVILVVLASYVSGILAQEPILENFAYLPVGFKAMGPLPTPTATHTPIWRPTSSLPTDTPVSPPPPPTSTPRPAGVAR